MLKSELHYEFPERLIARSVSHPPSAARLLIYHRAAQKIQHSQFSRLSEFLRSDDVIVINETKVLRAKFSVTLVSGKVTEGLYIGGNDSRTYVWIKGRVDQGDTIELFQKMAVRVLSRNDLDLEIDLPASQFEDLLKVHGEVPLPPYIRSSRKKWGEKEERSDDFEDYQNPFAREAALTSVASPTASLHFDDLLRQSLIGKGIQFVHLELGVGAGTFAPLRHEVLSENELHEEVVRIPQESWNRLKALKTGGSRLIAVGTTCVRALEAATQREERGENPDEFRTSLFIYPPYRFRMVDGLITNFHWPQTSLLSLVATFLEPGSEKVEGKWKALYEEAIQNEYRLFSLGDGMLIL